MFRDQKMLDETAKDACNRQTTAWISHDLIRNNQLAFSSMTNLQFYRFQNTEIVPFVFQRIDVNDMFSDITGK